MRALTFWRCDNRVSVDFVPAPAPLRCLPTPVSLPFLAAGPTPPVETDETDAWRAQLRVPLCSHIWQLRSPSAQGACGICERRAVRRVAGRRGVATYVAGAPCSVCQVHPASWALDGHHFMHPTPPSTLPPSPNTCPRLSGGTLSLPPAPRLWLVGLSFSSAAGASRLRGRNLSTAMVSTYLCSMYKRTTYNSCGGRLALASPH